MMRKTFSKVHGLPIVIDGRAAPDISFGCPHVSMVGKEMSSGRVISARDQVFVPRFLR